MSAHPVSISVFVWILIHGCFCGTLPERQQSVGNPADIAWQRWITMKDPSTRGSLRRITPKSIFIAPTFNRCAEGYHRDSSGNCVKIIQVNQEAQLQFLLQSLKSMFSSYSGDEANSFEINSDEPNSEEPNSDAPYSDLPNLYEPNSDEPFHLNLPLSVNEQPTDLKDNDATSISVSEDINYYKY